MADLKDKPKSLNSAVNKELEKAEKNFQEFDQSVKEMTMERMNDAPKLETDPQHKLSNRQIQAAPEHYLKPERVVSTSQKFNERFRDEYNYMKTYVPFIAEHNELRGDVIEKWTRPYGGMPAEFWRVPTNKPVWGPRYLAEEIKKCCYHRLVMQENVITDTNHAGKMYGQLAVDTTVQRLDAHPVNPTKKSVFLSAEGN